MKSTHILFLCKIRSNIEFPTKHKCPKWSILFEFRLKCCIYITLCTCVLRKLPTTLSVIWSPLLLSTNYEAFQHAIFSTPSLLLFFFLYQGIFLITLLFRGHNASLKVRDQVSYPYMAKDEVIFLNLHLWVSRIGIA
jgi:hypothetical protein